MGIPDSCLDWSWFTRGSYKSHQHRRQPSRYIIWAGQHKRLQTQYCCMFLCRTCTITCMSRHCHAVSQCHLMEMEVLQDGSRMAPDKQHASESPANFMRG